MNHKFGNTEDGDRVLYVCSDLKYIILLRSHIYKQETGSKEIFFLEQNLIERLKVKKKKQLQTGK